MFYLVQLYLNVEDKVQPFLSENIYDWYETHKKAFEEFSNNVYSGHMVCSSKSNSVTDYSVDIFNGYHKILMIVNADTYDNCLDTIDRWALDYLNDILKTRWLENQMKDLPTWYVVIGNEVPEAPLDILNVERIDQHNIVIEEVDCMLSGWSTYMPTNLSPVIVAKEYIPKDTPERYSLIIQAENEEAVKEVCRDFIRLYGDEHD